MKLTRLFIAAACLAASLATAQWQPLTHQPTFLADRTYLLSNGTVLVQDRNNFNSWWKLTPDIKGSYVNGTWSTISSPPNGYSPYDPYAATLKDGRLFVLGGEYGGATNAGEGYIYDPTSDSWTRLPFPPGITGFGNCGFTELPDGRLMAGSSDVTGYFGIFTPSTMSWSAAARAPLDTAEQQGTLLPDGSFFIELQGGFASRYVPSLNAWTPPTPTLFAGDIEPGPEILLYDGAVLAFTSTGEAQKYTPPSTQTGQGSWVNAGRTSGSMGDSSVCIVPSGHVIAAAYSGFPYVTQFNDYNGVGWTLLPNPPSAATSGDEQNYLLVLPTGQVLYTTQRNDVEIFTPAGAPNAAWKPTIASGPSVVYQGSDSVIKGTQFNGLSQGTGHGDDGSNPTNFPLVRITNNASGDVFYARTHDFSTMAVATGSLPVSATFTVPLQAETGPSTLVVVANGIASDPVTVDVRSKTIKSLVFKPAAVPSGTSTTGVITLTVPAPAGGLTVGLSATSSAAVIPATVTIAAGTTSISFPVSTTNPTYSSIVDTVTATYKTEDPTVATLTINPANYAQFVSQDTPSSMVASQTYSVTLQFKNTGATTWDTAHGYKLHSLSPLNNTTWGFNRIALANSPVAPGGTGIFKASVLAPSANGTYNFQWQMIEDSIGVAFGPGSPIVAVSVARAPDAAQFVSQAGVPGSIVAGTPFNPTLTFKNVGLNTWSSPAYVLKTRNPYNNLNWGQNTIPLDASVTPGSSIKFAPTLTAPWTPGTYGFQWSMMNISKGLLFGDLSTNLMVVVQPATYSAQFISETPLPSGMIPGAAFNQTITMKNVGTNAWSSSMVLASLNPVLNTNWGVSSLPVTTAVAAGSSFSFTRTFTAPTTTGNYHFAWRMSLSSSFFGDSTPDVLINVGPDQARFVSNNEPSSVYAGTSFYIQNTMANTGSTTWSSSAGYSMMSISPANNTTWGRSRNYLSGTGGFAPGTQTAIYGNCTAPLIPGTYVMQWQMDKNGVPFGDPTPYLAVKVSKSPDNSVLVSQEGIVTTLAHSTQFGCYWIFQNTGTTTWDSTYALVPITTPSFGVSSIPATTTTPGNNCQFGAVFTTPATPGTYHFQFRISHNGVLFGQPTTDVVITVT